MEEQQHSNVTALRPNDPELVRQTVQRMLDDGDFKQAEISRESGVSSSALSTFLGNSYKGNTQNVTDKLQLWIDQVRNRQVEIGKLPIAPKFYETRISRRVTSAAQYAQIAGDMVLIYGGAGLGKTEALRQYASTHPQCWMVEITKAHARLLASLNKIAYAVGIRNTSNRSDEIQDDIHARVLNTNGLLIIDEAQNLQMDALEAVRAIHDATKIGVVLSGNEVVYQRMTGGTRAPQFAQLFSRLGKRVRLHRPIQEDVDALCDAWKIPGARERELIAEIANKPGALRGATKTLRLAKMLSGGRHVNVDHIRAAWRDLSGESA